MKNTKPETIKENEHLTVNELIAKLQSLSIRDKQQYVYLSTRNETPSNPLAKLLLGNEMLILADQEKEYSNKAFRRI